MLFINLWGLVQGFELYNWLFQKSYSGLGRSLESEDESSAWQLPRSGHRSNLNFSDIKNTRGELFVNQPWANLLCSFHHRCTSFLCFNGRKIFKSLKMTITWDLARSLVLETTVFHYPQPHINTFTLNFYPMMNWLNAAALVTFYHISSSYYVPTYVILSMYVPMWYSQCTYLVTH